MKFAFGAGARSVMPVGLLLLGSSLGACGSDTQTGGAAGSAAGSGAAGAAGSLVAGAPGSGSSNTGAAGNAGLVSGGGTGASAAGSPGNGLGGGGTSGLPAAGQAGASEGGASQGGASQGGAASSTTGCAGKPYKLCEDFETGSVGALPTGWTSYQGYGTSSPQDQTLSTEQFHSGKMALKSTSGAKGISRIQKSLASLGATANKHWGRIFYRVQIPFPVPSDYFHVTFVGAYNATTENRIVDTVTAKSSNAHQWLFNNPNDSGGKSSAYSWTFDAAWHCAEWYVDVSTKSYRFFHDAEEVTALAFTNLADSQMSDYKSIIVGATHYQPDALAFPFVVWFDDLAIDDNQIGCK